MPNNEEDIIDSLYKLYEQSMYYEAYKILHDEYLAEDAVHEAFLRLIRNRNKISNPSSREVRNYAYKTLKSAALDIYRRQKKQRENCCESMETIEFLFKDDNANSNNIVSLISKLPPKYATVMRCLFIRELSIHETSAVLRISEACIRKRCERARKLLKRIKEEKED